MQSPASGSADNKASADDKASAQVWVEGAEEKKCLDVRHHQWKLKESTAWCRGTSMSYRLCESGHDTVMKREATVELVSGGAFRRAPKDYLNQRLGR